MKPPCLRTPAHAPLVNVSLFLRWLPCATDQDMAGRSRAKQSAIQILKTAELTPAECKRPIVKQFHVRAALA